MHFFLGFFWNKRNNTYVEKIYNENKNLDFNQLRVVHDNSKYLLVVAGAGSGKSFTIVEKIKYLINNCNVLPSEILCISFTNDSVNSLKEKLKLCKVDVVTFHKLGLNILKSNGNYNLCPDNYLDYIINEFFYGVIFENPFLMKKVLSFFHVYFYFDVNVCYKNFVKNNPDKISSLIKLLSKFLKLFKSNAYDIEMFSSFFKSTSSRKERHFLLITLNIYLIYQNDLHSSLLIDFDDIITMSYEMINTKKINLNYKYVIVDEYQDTSYSRYLLIKSIIDLSNSSFVGVGDDFQSIYRFSGCSVNMFINFLDYFKQGKILKLEKTYRNSQELIDVAGNFIMKNESHLEKQLVSDKHLYKPIKICYGYTVHELVSLIDTDIMILGRNNRDISNINVNSDKNITILTVHRSKGLESSNVIIVNCIDDLLGFPNKLEDNKVLRLVSNEGKDLYSEERRLFYVALTRSKNYVYILTQKNKESIFVKELLRDYSSNIEILKR